MKNLKAIIKRIAQEEGCSPQDIYSEMQKAIDTGFDSSDPGIKAAWDRLQFKGDRPAPAEIIAHCISRVGSQR